MRQSIPKYVREHLHKFHQLEQPWQTQVDSTLNTYLSNFKRLVQQLNVFSMYSFNQLQQVADFAVNGLNKLRAAFDQESAVTATAIAKLQSQVDELATAKPDVPPSPPDTGTCAVETLTTLEESVCQLWARQPPLNLKQSFSCV
ncbi:hypothetical protein DSO57_1032048 [Entomophthora muscae]|uniref:Uncharacterized protein n=1 Tax=Entomophthora muscae TaxID=34485 RepID=A0ACC2RRF7_9FUNG|nr:hypothetical protein DSO57_1032048 [Entomophthora muscae]